LQVPKKIVNMIRLFGVLALAPSCQGDREDAITSRTAGVK
jgi:hypothetical protein